MTSFLEHRPCTEKSGSANPLRREIENLLTEIQHARERLYADPSPVTSKTPSGLSAKSSSKSTASSQSTKKSSLKSPSRARTMIRKVSLPFRLARSRSQHKTYREMDETTALISDERRGSADSDATLVGSTSSSAACHSAGELLDILAPLVSALQRITPVVSDQIADSAMVERHAVSCDQLLNLLADLACRHDDRGVTGDEHDLEMTDLMLDALHKKVEAERAVVHGRAGPVVEQLSGEETVFEPAPRSQIQASPLLVAARNPFIAHSASIALASNRRSSSTGSVPIVGQVVPPGTYGAFIGGAQQTWARNVIRIGSYQNSLLFSPSPVAVRPIAAVTGL